MVSEHRSPFLRRAPLTDHLSFRFNAATPPYAFTSHGLLFTSPHPLFPHTTHAPALLNSRATTAHAWWTLRFFTNTRHTTRLPPLRHAYTPPAFLPRTFRFSLADAVCRAVHLAPAYMRFTRHTPTPHTAPLLHRLLVCSHLDNAPVTTFIPCSIPHRAAHRHAATLPSPFHLDSFWFCYTPFFHLCPHHAIRLPRCLRFLHALRFLPDTRAFILHCLCGHRAALFAATHAVCPRTFRGHYLPGSRTGLEHTLPLFCARFCPHFTHTSHCHAVWFWFTGADHTGLPPVSGTARTLPCTFPPPDVISATRSAVWLRFSPAPTVLPRTFWAAPHSRSAAFLPRTADITPLVGLSFFGFLLSPSCGFSCALRYRWFTTPGGHHLLLDGLRFCFRRTSLPRGRTPVYTLRFCHAALRTVLALVPCPATRAPTDMYYAAPTARCAYTNSCARRAVQQTRKHAS